MEECAQVHGIVEREHVAAVAGVGGHCDFGGLHREIASGDGVVVDLRVERCRAVDTAVLAVGVVYAVMRKPCRAAGVTVGAALLFYHGGIDWTAQSEIIEQGHHWPLPRWVGSALILPVEIEPVGIEWAWVGEIIAHRLHIPQRLARESIAAENRTVAREFVAEHPQQILPQLLAAVAILWICGGSGLAIYGQFIAGAGECHISHIERIEARRAHHVGGLASESVVVGQFAAECQRHKWRHVGGVASRKLHFGQ